MNKEVVDPSLAATFLTPFETKQQLKDWIFTFLGLDFPDTHIDKDSNSSPVDWLYDLYQIYKLNQGNKVPSVIVVSSRESYKTLTQSVWGILLMSHFRATLAHMAAIVPQASAAQKYVSDFLRKVQPYLDHHGIVIESQNTKEIILMHPDNTRAGMKIIVATLQGSNSSHTNCLTLDEIDTIRQAEGIRAYKEVQFVPGVFNGQHPITIKTSTMKFPGGLFAKELAIAKEKKWPIWRWNILDITEWCSPLRCEPDAPKVLRYVGLRLPLKTITAEIHAQLVDKERADYELVELYKGCSECSLGPICRGALHHRSPNDRGGLWKPIDFTISQFDKNDPDMAEAQLLCWKPSSQGMVYPRFEDRDDMQGNTYTLEQAWEVYTGEKKDRVTLEELVDKMIKNGQVFHCGGDWGHVHAFAVDVVAVMPNGESWLMDCYSVPGLEFEQMIDLGEKIRDTYNRPKMWYMDTNQPMFRKAFSKRKMPCKDFKKDVMGGISAVRGQIIDARGRRRLKVIKHERTKMLLKMFAEHCFKLDSLGNLTDEPDDSDVADCADALRYAYQNLFKPKGTAYTPTDNIPKPLTPFTELKDWRTLLPETSEDQKELLADFGQ